MQRYSCLHVVQLDGAFIFNGHISICCILSIFSVILFIYCNTNIVSVIIILITQSSRFETIEQIIKYQGSFE